MLTRLRRAYRELTRRAPRKAPERTAIVSCITDNFIGLGAAFLQSLVDSKSVPNNCDVILLTCPVYAPLNEENRALLRRVIPSLQFEQVDTSFLSDDLVRRWVGGKVVKANIDAILPGKKSVYLKLHVLRMERYSAIMWMDSDMIVLRSIAGLFRLPSPLCMVPSGESSHSYGLDYGVMRTGFNSGLMVIRKPYISQQWFARAVSLLNEKNHTNVQDQSLLNHLWRKEPKLMLPHVYNWKVPKDADKPFHERALEEARVIHFVAQSKWALADQPDMPLNSCFHRLREKANAPMIAVG